MKIYKVKVNGKSYRVELQGIEEIASGKVVEAKKKPLKPKLLLLLVAKVDQLNLLSKVPLLTSKQVLVL